MPVTMIERTDPGLEDFNNFLREILNITGLVLPDGYDVSKDAPNTWEAARDYLASTGRICVLPGRDPTGVLPEASYGAFRAWHDWVHVTCGCKFSENGENEAAIIQEVMLAARVGRVKAKRWLHLLQREVVDSNNYQRKGVEIA